MATISDLTQLLFSNSYSCQNIEDTIWQVGCYQINPTTPRGQKFFILHMLVKYSESMFTTGWLLLQVLPLIPITALVIQNSVNMNTLLGYQNRVSTIRRQVIVIQNGKMKNYSMCDSQVRGAMEIALFIQNIQEERAEVWVWPGKNLPKTIYKRRKNTEKVPQKFTGPNKLPERYMSRLPFTSSPISLTVTWQRWNTMKTGL